MTAIFITEDKRLKVWKGEEGNHVYTENDKLMSMSRKSGGKLLPSVSEGKEFWSCGAKQIDSTGFPAGMRRPGRNGLFRFSQVGADDAFPNIDPGLVEMAGRKLISGSWEIWSHMMELQYQLWSHASAACHVYEKRMSLRTAAFFHYRIETGRR